MYVCVFVFPNYFKCRRRGIQMDTFSHQIYMHFTFTSYLLHASSNAFTFSPPTEKFLLSIEGHESPHRSNSTKPPSLSPSRPNGRISSGIIPHFPVHLIYFRTLQIKNFLRRICVSHFKLRGCYYMGKYHLKICTGYFINGDRIF
jgi:hypothetical protein